jgi:hypothetical protein
MCFPYLRQHDTDQKFTDMLNSSTYRRHSCRPALSITRPRIADILVGRPFYRHNLKNEHDGSRLDCYPHPQQLGYCP